MFLSQKKILAALHIKQFSMQPFLLISFGTGDWHTGEKNVEKNTNSHLLAHTPYTNAYSPFLN